MKPATMTRFGRAPFAALLAFISLSIAAVSSAAPPATMSFQGYLTGAGGVPVTGSQAMTFRLYNVASGGAALWTEAQPSVAVAGGIYNVTLGSVTPIALPFDVPYFLGITVGSDAEMTPRLALATVGYAFRAAQVDLVVTSSIADGGVTAAKVADANITTAKIADANITTAKVADANITTAKIADANITTAKIADASVTKSKLSAAGGTAGQMLTTDGASLSWSAPPAALAPINPLGNTITAVDSAGNVGRWTAITLGADGLPVISYRDGGNLDLKVARCANAACTGAATITTVDSAGAVGDHTSITVGADGLPVISYYDVTNQDLKVAKCVNAACTGTSTITTLDSGGNVGQWSSITLASDGLPVISYYDVTNGDLKVAKCTTAACNGATITTVDSTGDVGRHSSIVLGSDGFPVISYYDFTNFDLKVAKCVTATCAGSTLTTVDSATNVGEWTSITLGADGLPVISYFEGTTFFLKVAKCTDAACAGFSIVPVAGGQQGSIAVGADGLPVISYYDVALQDLKVVKCANAACTIVASNIAVDTTGTVGDHSSITIGADGLPIISYFDSGNQDMKVVKCSSPGCVPHVRRR